jgi:peroxiredoxin
MTRRAQWIAIACGAVALTAAAWIATKELDRGPVTVGSRAPAFSAVTLDSVPVVRTLGDYAGTVTFVNVWATWCAPCEREMPMLQQLYEEFGPRGFRLVAISADAPGSEDAIRDFVTQLGLTFDILHDPDGAIRQLYQIVGFPESIIIDKQGIIRFRHMSAIDEEEAAAIRALLPRLLAERAD